MKGRKRERWGEGFRVQGKGRWLVPESPGGRRGARGWHVGRGLEQAGMCFLKMNEGSVLATLTHLLISGNVLLHFVLFSMNGANDNSVLFSLRLCQD